MELGRKNCFGRENFPGRKNFWATLILLSKNCFECTRQKRAGKFVLSPAGNWSEK